MKTLDNERRVVRLIDEAIAALELDLTGLRVLTEAASGAFVVTPLIAARAGAARVHAVTRDSPYGRATDVLEYTRHWAERLGVADRMSLSTAPAAELAGDADVVTNLGFVRPIDARLINRLPSHAVVSLMWEPWEFRAADIDLAACDAAGILVVGTNETDPRLRIFEYVGVLAVKLLLECGVEAVRSRLLVIGSDPFGHEVEQKLAALGADVVRVPLPPTGGGLDSAAGELVASADAVVLVEHRDRRELIGDAGGIRPARLAASGCPVVHIAGTVDDDALARAGGRKHPALPAKLGYMTLATDYVGVRPVIDLHAGGLAVGAMAARIRLAGGSVLAALERVERSGLGLRVGGGLTGARR